MWTSWSEAPPGKTGSPTAECVRLCRRMSGKDCERSERYPLSPKCSCDSGHWMRQIPIILLVVELISWHLPVGVETRNWIHHQGSRLLTSSRVATFCRTEPKREWYWISLNLCLASSSNFFALKCLVYTYLWFSFCCRNTTACARSTLRCADSTFVICNGFLVSRGAVAQDSHVPALLRRINIAFTCRIMGLLKSMLGSVSCTWKEFAATRLSILPVRVSVRQFFLHWDAAVSFFVETTSSFLNWETLCGTDIQFSRTSKKEGILVTNEAVVSGAVRPIASARESCDQMPVQKHIIDLRLPRRNGRSDFLCTRPIQKICCETWQFIESECKILHEIVRSCPEDLWSSPEPKDQEGLRGDEGLYQDPWSPEYCPGWKPAHPRRGFHGSDVAFGLLEEEFKCMGPKGACFEGDGHVSESAHTEEDNWQIMRIIFPEHVLSAAVTVLGDRTAPCNLVKWVTPTVVSCSLGKSCCWTLFETASHAENRWMECQE